MGKQDWGPPARQPGSDPLPLTCGLPLSLSSSSSSSSERPPRGRAAARSQPPLRSPASRGEAPISPGPARPPRPAAPPPSPPSAVTGELLPAALGLCGKTRGGQTAAGAAGRQRAGAGRTYLAAGSGPAPPRPHAACGPCARGRASPSCWGRASAPWPRRQTPRPSAAAATRAALPAAPAHAPAAGPPAAIADWPLPATSAARAARPRDAWGRGPAPPREPPEREGAGRARKPPGAGLLP